MTTMTPDLAPRRDTRLLWLAAAVAVMVLLARYAPAMIGRLLQAGIELAFQLAILGLVMAYVSRFWPF